MSKNITAAAIKSFGVAKWSLAYPRIIFSHKAENKGNYQEAVAAYEGALSAAKKQGLMATWKLKL